MGMGVRIATWEGTEIENPFMNTSNPYPHSQPAPPPSGSSMAIRLIGYGAMNSVLLQFIYWLWPKTDWKRS